MCVGVCGCVECGNYNYNYNYNFIPIIIIIFIIISLSLAETPRETNGVRVRPCKSHPLGYRQRSHLRATLVSRDAWWCLCVCVGELEGRGEGGRERRERRKRGELIGFELLPSR